jgi:hypothetical protein
LPVGISAKLISKNAACKKEKKKERKKGER